MSVSNDFHTQSVTRDISLRRTSSAGNSSDTDATQVEPTTRPGLPFLKKRFTSSWARKNTDSDDEKVARGPLGLRLLHSSPEPLVDIIFVHGLRGGSMKTWRKGNDPRNFWPQLWLPVEPELHNANIHSFGYDSDWVSTKSSILNVHDFGQSLLEEMRNSPYLRDKANGPILLIGHSMGGLVIKKAFVLASSIPEFRERIRCIFFLATPHRGSDYAATLNNILTISGIMSSRHYITDITTGSTSAQSINEEFGKCASDLPIFSFYETLQMKLGISSSLIVEKSSAILGLGFQRERVQYLNANHRDICKFDSPEDPNYVTLKNAIISITQDILKDGIETTMRESRARMKVLQSYLSISDHQDEHYPRVEGSCQWIDDRDDFQDWRDPAGELALDKISAPEKNPSIFWVAANPGTGKTYLAAHVIDELSEYQLECSHYFFHVGNKTSRSLGNLLRSIAFQMAMSNAFVREKLVDLCNEGTTFDKDDAATIWNKVFKRGIFQARISTPQYWVIDAVDECSKYQEMFTLIKGIQLSFPLRIFITSRKIPDLQKIHRSLDTSISINCIDVAAEDSSSDIDCYISERVNNLANDLRGGKEEIAEILRRRSNACFLWVRLVLDELEKVFTTESVSQILQSIPEGMIPYYERTVKVMAENTLEKYIAITVLVWAVATSRDLYISELSNALKLDINTVLPSAKSAVEGLCGQLIFVDPQSGVVSLVHTTVREFLLSESAGEFQISKPRAHERIALTCLKLLSSGEMKPPRSQRVLGQARKNQEPSPLLHYAISQFSEHVYSASAETDEVLIALDLFLKTNILSWIERVAKAGDLYPLIRVSKNLKSYLDRRAKYISPLSSQVQTVESWSTDLSRIATKFGPALLQDPSSIYFMIPPFCPLDSAIYKQFAKRSGPSSLAIIGYKEHAWDDCIASVNFGDDSIAAAVSCGENLIAVGMESGDINLFNRKSCQTQGVIHQKYPIDLIHFTDRSIAACTTRTVVLTDRMGNTIWQIRIRFRCILLTSSSEAVVAVSQHGHVFRWDISTGALLGDQTFAFTDPDDDGENEHTVKAPDTASISADMETLALAYRGGTTCIFEVESGEVIAWPRDESKRLASVLLFNPNPNISLLLIIYMDHELALYEIDTGVLVSTQATSSPAGILSAACSPDGRTLATVDKQGVFQIWDFESLSLLYHVLSPAASFRILDFVSDGSSVVDLTDSDMRIWNPATLVRKNVEEDQSISDDALYLTATEGEYETRRVSRITTLCAHPSLSVVFAGRHTGQVTTFNTKTGMQIAAMPTHPHGPFVSELVVGRNGIMASGDVNCVVKVWNLRPNLTPDLLYTYTASQIKGRIKQLCFTASGDHLIVSTTQSDHVYAMKDGSCVGSLPFGQDERKVWRWLQVPARKEEPEQFALVCDHMMAMFSASGFPSRADDRKIDLPYDVSEGNVETDINAASILFESKFLVLDVRYASGYVSCSSMFLIDLDKGTSLNEVLPRYCKHLIGVSQRTRSIVFLHQNSWLCSMDLAGLALGRYTQHFYVPNEYMSVRHEVLPVLTADDNVVFCLHGELAVVVNGLNLKEMKTFV